jgi:hypothetical protein
MFRLLEPSSGKYIVLRQIIELHKLLQTYLKLQRLAVTVCLLICGLVIRFMVVCIKH